MKIAIMQPYLFPYIGYFQLIYAVDKFVFLDDVNFIKKGWINRNRLRLQNKEWLFSIPCKNISQNNQICDTMVDWETNFTEKFLKTLQMNYSKAPFYQPVFDLVKKILSYKHKTISLLAISSILEFCDYFDLQKEFKIASNEGNYSRNLKSADRLIDIVQKENCSIYVNAIGGINLYDKTYFKQKSVDLYFLKTKLNENYDKNHYISFFSIIDLAMYNSIDKIKNYLEQYELI